MDKKTDKISTTRAIIYTALFIIFIFVFGQFFMVALGAVVNVVVPFIFSFENRYITIFFIVFFLVIIGFLTGLSEIAATGIGPAKAFRKYYFWKKRQEKMVGSENASPKETDNEEGGVTTKNINKNT